MKTLQAGQVIRFGWETFKKRPWFFMGTLLVVNVLSSFSFEIDEAQWEGVATTEGAFVIALGMIAAFIVNTLARMGGNTFLLKAHHAPEAARFADIWAPRPFWRFVGASILKGIVIGAPLLAIVGAGFIAGMQYIPLFVILGIPAVLWLVYAAVRLAFVELVVMDKGSMPVDALKESYRITEGHFWELVLLMLLSGGVILLGVLALVVGLVVAFPVVMFAFVHAYKLLSGHHGHQA